MKNGKILLLLAFITLCLASMLAGCNNGSNDSSGGGNGGGGNINPVTAPYIYTYTSSDAENHNHTVRVYNTALNNPSGGWNDTSSFTLEHAHTMNLTNEMLISLNNNGSVTALSSSVPNPVTGSYHTLSWTMTKAFIQASSANENHSHDVNIGLGEVGNPPPSGIQYTTTAALNHTHNVTLTQAELTTLNTGGSVSVTSSATINPGTGTTHYHTWTLLKPY